MPKAHRDAKSAWQWLVKSGGIEPDGPKWSGVAEMSGMPSATRVLSLAWRVSAAQSGIANPKLLVVDVSIKDVIIQNLGCVPDSEVRCFRERCPTNSSITSIV